MRVLVVGGGGREDALVWKLSQSRRVRQIFCAPGNAGISRKAECVDVRSDDLDGLRVFARSRKIDLTVVGPELPLSLGIVDAFEKEGLRIFGPRKSLAWVESSKVRAKQFMSDHHIPTARSKSFDQVGEALEYASRHPLPLVIKADGLAAGKGVIIAQNVEETRQAILQIMEKRVFGSAGDQIVIEEFLTGQEATVMVFADGQEFREMPASQDHKRVEDGDQGANTGGMGAYAPAPVVNRGIREQVLQKIIQPTLKGLAEQDDPYQGILYFGLMISPEGPRVLEFNCRFGDPEAQVILPLLDSDLVDIFEAVVERRLDQAPVRWKEGSTICVVLTSGGYPGPYPRGIPIQGLEKDPDLDSVILFHAGTAQREDSVVTDGGRVLGVTALGTDLKEARQLAYQEIEGIHFDGMHYRKDIGVRALPD